MQAFWVVGAVFVVIATFGSVYHIIFTLQRAVARKDRQLEALRKETGRLVHDKKIFLEAYLQRVEQLRLELAERITTSGAEARLKNEAIDVGKLKNALVAAPSASSQLLTCQLIGKALDRTLELWRSAEPTLVCCEYVRMCDEDLASRVAVAKATLSAAEVPENLSNGYRALPALIESVENRRRAAVVQLQSTETRAFGSVVLELDAAAAAMRRIEELIGRAQPTEPSDIDGA